MTLHAFAKTLLAAALISTAFTGAAFARDRVFTAQLASPAPEHVRVIADDTLWQCEGESCRAVSRHPSTVRDCRQLVREIGPVTAYGPEDDKLSEDELARCNEAAPATQQARN